MQYLIGKTTREMNKMITDRTALIATIKAPEGHEIDVSILRTRWHKDEYQCMTRDGQWHSMIHVRDA